MEKMCNGCDGVESKSKDFFVEESLFLLNKSNRRMWIAILVLIIALIGTNLAWLIYESQFEIVDAEQTITASQDGDSNNVAGGDITIGADGND